MVAEIANSLAALYESRAVVEDGSMARKPDLEKFAQEHDLKIGTIMDLIHYRIAHEQTIQRTHQRI